MKQFINNLSIGRKLGGAFAVVVGIFLLSAVVGQVLAANAENDWQAAMRWNDAVGGAQAQADGTQKQMASQALYVATFEPKYKAEWQQGVDDSEKGAKTIDSLHNSTISKISSAATAADEQHDATVHKLLFPAVARGDHAAAVAALKKADRLVRVPLGAQERIASYVNAQRKERISSAEGAASTARTFLIVLTLLAVAIAGFVAYFIASGIKKLVAAVLDRSRSLVDNDVTDLAAALDAMAEGDLTQTVTPTTEAIEVTSHDEVGQVAEAVNGIRDRVRASVESYNAMAAKLSGVIGEVSGTAGTVSSASQQMASTSEEAGKAVGEIATAVGDVAQGAERQVRQVESVKGSADEAALAAQTSAEQAREAAEVAEQARELAQEGVGAAEQATEAMRSVRDSSESVTGAIRDLASKSDEIGAIVETITGIAGQTNLLALNAAIEAARAGEQGRGFAVVAEEVRKLAEESQQAAEEISGLIEQIQGETQKVVGVVEDGARRTEDGVATVEQTRDAFTRIGGSVEDVTGRIAQIAGAAEQISSETAKMQDEITGVAAVAEQSSASTEQVSASTEQTSASAQEIAASAQELASTAEGLERLVSQFKVVA
ncbi:MAG: methyl-accepting chemotaxis protein [Thermoleophilaceae bacterium]